MGHYNVLSGIEGSLTFLLTMCVLVWVAIVFHIKPYVAMPMTLGAALIGYWLKVPLVSAGPIAIYIQDAVAAALLLAFVLGLMSRRSLSSLAIGWLALGGLVVIALIRGVLAYGFEQAGLSTRAWVWFLSPVLFFGSRYADRELIRYFYKSWSLAFLLMIGTAFLFLFRNGFGTYAESGARALDSPQALILSQGVIISFAARREASSWVRRWMIPLLGLSVIVFSQQRTVWVVTALCMALIAMPGMSLGHSARKRARVLIAFSLIGFLGLLIAGPSSLTSSLDRAASEPGSANSTLGWRIEGWLSTFEERQSAPVVDNVIGQPAGRGFTRFVEGTLVTVSPHNLYVATAIAMGVTGLVLLLMSYFSLLKDLGTNSGKLGGNSGLTIRVLLIGQLIYFMAYQTSLEQGVVTGLACAVAHTTGAGRINRRESVVAQNG